VVLDAVTELPEHAWALAKRFQWAELVPKEHRAVFGQPHSLNYILCRLSESAAEYWLRWEDSWLVSAPFISRSLALLQTGKLLDVSVAEGPGHMLHVREENTLQTWNGVSFYFQYEDDTPAEVGAPPMRREAPAHYIIRQRCDAYNPIAQDSLAWQNENQERVWPGFSLRPGVSLSAPMLANGPFDTQPMHWPFRFETYWACRLLAGQPRRVYSFVLLEPPGANNSLRGRGYTHTYRAVTGVQAHKAWLAKLVAERKPLGSWLGRPPCAVPPGALWAFLAHHKTGHVLLTDLGRQIARLRFKSDRASRPVGRWSNDPNCSRQLRARCISPHLRRSEGVRSLGALYFFYPPCEDPQLCEDFAHGAWESAHTTPAGPHAPQGQPTSVRILHFVRDPVNVTLSSFFYHLHSRGTGQDAGDYKMLYDVGGHRVQQWVQFCVSRPGRRGGPSKTSKLDGASQPYNIRGSVERAAASSAELASACNASAPAVADPSGWSYQALLRSLPLRDALMVEAWFALQVTIVPEAIALRTLGAAKYAGMVLQVDLQDSLDDFDATWSRIFRHLLGAVSVTQLASCVRSVRRHDLGRQTRSGMPSHATSASTPLQVRATAKAVLLGSEWFQVTLRSLSWEDVRLARPQTAGAAAGGSSPSRLRAPRVHRAPK
jgi:hypothetical protein